jgi:uncharacterized protein with HEPN domain
VKPGREANEVNLSRAIEHLRAAISYSERGRETFFDEEVPDTFLLVEGELRKAFESLNRLGRSFFSANSQLDRDRVGEIRQLLTHDYSDVDRDLVWAIVREDAPKTLRILSRARRPRES